MGTAGKLRSAHKDSQSPGMDRLDVFAGLVEGLPGFVIRGAM